MGWEKMDFFWRLCYLGDKKPKSDVVMMPGWDYKTYNVEDLALGLHSIGMVGKFFAEAIEHAHPAPIEAAEASGATSLQVISHGVMPQVFPQFADVTMYRWEYNFRASTVMGMVGAGGIGTELVGSLRLLDYPQVSAVLIVILATVTIVDALSNMLRKRFQ